MAETPHARTDLLDDLELRQADLLRRLDDLNDRVEQTLREQSSQRKCGIGPHCSPPRHEEHQEK